MSDTPTFFSVHSDGSTLVLRIPMDDVNPLVPRMWDGLQRARRLPGQEQLARVAHAVLLRAISQTILDHTPDMRTEARAAGLIDDGE